MKNPLLFLFFLYIFFYSYAQSEGPIKEAGSFAFPASFEGKMGFIPSGMAFINDSTFFVNSYYAGLYKFRLSGDKIVTLDSFIIEEKDIPLFDSINRAAFEKKGKPYAYTPYHPDPRIGLGLSQSTSKIYAENGRIYLIVHVNFMENVEADSGQMLQYDTIKASSITYIRQPTYLLSLDTQLDLKSANYIDSDSFFQLSKFKNLTSGFSHFALSGLSLVSEVSYIGFDRVTDKSSVLFEWVKEEEVYYPKSFIREVTFSEQLLKSLKAKKPRVLNAIRSVRKKDKTIYVATVDRLYFQKKGEAFELLDTFRIDEKGTLFDLLPIDSDLIFLTFKKERKDESKKSKIIPYLYHLREKKLISIESENEFRGGYLSKSPHYVFTISFNELGSFDLNRYRLTTGTK